MKQSAQTDQPLSDAADRFATLARKLEVSSAPIAEIADSLAKSLRGIRWPTPDDIERGHQEMLNTARAVAKVGWTLPKHLTPSETSDLVKRCRKGSSRALDQWFLNYYEANGRKEFKRLTRKLLRNRWLNEWRPVLKDCVWAYQHNRYRLVVATMLAVLEGAVAKLGRAPSDRRKTHPHVIWKKVRSQPKSMDEVFWESASEFLCQVWKNTDFDTDPPDLINRHWILHGRMPNIGSQPDALRLFVATEFVADYSEGLVGSRTKP